MIRKMKYILGRKPSNTSTSRKARLKHCGQSKGRAEARAKPGGEGGWASHSATPRSWDTGEGVQRGLDKTPTPQAHLTPGTLLCTACPCAWNAAPPAFPWPLSLNQGHSYSVTSFLSFKGSLNRVLLPLFYWNETTDPGDICQHLEVSLLHVMDRGQGCC